MTFLMTFVARDVDELGNSPQASHLWAVLTACANAQLPDTAADRYQEPVDVRRQKCFAKVTEK